MGSSSASTWAFDGRTQLRLGAAVYDFSGIEGVRETEPPPSGPRAGTVPYQLSQYPSSARQRGNTLINLNDPTSTAAPVWGLASKFRPINLSAALTLKQFEPMQLGIGFDYVKNGAFDIGDIQHRAGLSSLDLANKTSGYQLKVQFGAPRLAERGQWSTFAAYRLFQRDAWLDAFTDTTWNLGGTNYKGFSLGGAYALDHNTTFGVRWTSTRNLDDGRRIVDPVTNAQFGNLSSAPLKIEVIPGRGQFALLSLESNMNGPLSIPLRLLLAGVLSVSMTMPAGAQDDKRVSREREALRAHPAGAERSPGAARPARSRQGCTVEGEGRCRSFAERRSGRSGQHAIRASRRSSRRSPGAGRMGGHSTGAG